MWQNQTTIRNTPNNHRFTTCLSLASHKVLLSSKSSVKAWLNTCHLLSPQQLQFLCTPFMLDLFCLSSGISPALPHTSTASIALSSLAWMEAGWTCSPCPGCCCLSSGAAQVTERSHHPVLHSAPFTSSWPSFHPEGDSCASAVSVTKHSALGGHIVAQGMLCR